VAASGAHHQLGHPKEAQTGRRILFTKTPPSRRTIKLRRPLSGLGADLAVWRAPPPSGRPSGRLGASGARVSRPAGRQTGREGDFFITALGRCKTRAWARPQRCVRAAHRVLVFTTVCGTLCAPHTLSACAPQTVSAGDCLQEPLAKSTRRLLLLGAQIAPVARPAQ